MAFLSPLEGQATALDLTVSGVVVNFQGLRAIDNVSLQLKRGEVLGLIGPNGAGKTTLVNVLTGFQEVDSGEVRLAGEDINAVYGRSIAGHYFAEVFSPHEVDLIVERYRRALSEPAIFTARGAVYAAAGRLTEGERIGLPMLGREGVTNTLLGATVYGARLVPGCRASTPFAPPTIARHRFPAASGRVDAAHRFAGGTIWHV